MGKQSRRIMTGLNDEERIEESKWRQEIQSYLKGLQRFSISFAAIGGSLRCMVCDRTVTPQMFMRAKGCCATCFKGMTELIERRAPLEEFKAYVAKRSHK